MAPTLVSKTMTTAKWLRTILGPLPPKPLLELQHFLSSCDGDLTEDVTHPVNVILEAIFPSSIIGERSTAGSLQTATRMDSGWAEQRRCMLACSAELVLATHKTVTMMFSVVLETDDE